MKFKDKTWILISILSLITAAVWLAVAVKNTFSKPTIPENLEEISKPLDPRIDTDILEQLKKRTQN